MKPISSVITITQEAPRSKIGTQGGERGLQTQSSSAIAAWLAKHSPADMDRAAVSRASQHNVDLAVRLEGRYPTGPNGERLPSYDVAVGCDIGGTTENRAAAKADLEKFMTPAPIREIEGWLAELSVISASRKREGVESALMLTAYSSRLAQYPADVVRYALLERSWSFWPTWDELRRVCEAKASPRRHMIAALSMPEPDPQPERRASTQEEKDRIAAMVAEQFPHIPQGWKDRAVEEVTKGKCISKKGGDV